jgi:ABC-2 type transport system ATP-binding protein
MLFATLREHLPRFFVASLRRRVGPGVEVEVTGRRLRLAADTQEALGRGLAVVLADGIELDGFRTPPGRLEQLLRGRPVPADPEPAPTLHPVPFPPPGWDADAA